MNCPRLCRQVAQLFTMLPAVSSPAGAAGVFTPRYTFTGGADGAAPRGTIVFDSAGNMYGETSAGADLCSVAQFGTQNHGCGTLYKLSPGGQLTTLLTFSGPNGAVGNGTPLLDGNVLYASAYKGGASNDGVIFSIHTDGADFQLLHQFTGRDGAQPIGPLVPAKGGGAYGLTYYGGYKAHSGVGYGTLFKIGPNGKLITLHAFRGPDGAQPTTLLSDAAGTLYGSTAAGSMPPARCTV